jgi:7-cyano-7-deazaguanine synthase
VSHAIVLLSGGVDSAVALFWARKQANRLTALSLNYFQRPAAEERAARSLAEGTGATLIEVPLPFIKEATDLRAEGFRVPSADGAPEGLVPVRNLVFYSIAAYYAEAVGADLIVGGHIRQDAESFPDAAPSYFDDLEKLVARAHQQPGERRIRFALPLATMTKTEVLKLAVQLEVPLAQTWSCYHDAKQPCGRCVSCRERAEAFAACGLSDPGRR